MDKEKLISLIELLNQAEKKDRNLIIAKSAEENGLKFKEVMKLLMEAGYDPKAESQNNSQLNSPGDPEKKSPDDTPDDSKPKTEGKKITVMLRHKTEYPGYRCAGLVLTQRAAAHEVTEAQLAKLRKDPWVEIVDEKKGGKQQ